MAISRYRLDCSGWQEQYAELTEEKQKLNCLVTACKNALTEGMRTTISQNIATNAIKDSFCSVYNYIVTQFNSVEDISHKQQYEVFTKYNWKQSKIELKSYIANCRGYLRTVCPRDHPPSVHERYIRDKIYANVAETSFKIKTILAEYKDKSEKCLPLKDTEIFHPC